MAGLFAAGGTGEGFSLTPDEIRAGGARRRRGGRRHGARPRAGHRRTAQAIEKAKAAEAAGADGILLLPPYLTEADQAGLIEHVSAVCGATSLGVIVYNRANAVYKDTRWPPWPTATPT